MRIVWWLPVSDWRDWANVLLEYGLYAHVHYDQNLLLADPATKKFSTTSINCDILAIDRELFPVPDGYVEYDSSADRWKIYYWTALKDLLDIARQKGVMIVNTGGMFSWYCCTRKGVIPDTVTQVDVELPWGWETANKVSSWGNAEWSQDIWDLGDRGQRSLYYYVRGTDPGASIQGFTDDLYAPLPFTGIVYHVPRALRVEGASVSCVDAGFTPLKVYDTYDYGVSATIKAAVTGVNFNCPVVIYGISFSNQYDAINVIIDLLTGLTSLENYSVVHRPPVEILNPLEEPVNFAYAWAGPTHLKLLFKVRNRSKSKVVLSVSRLIELDYFIKLDRELARYINNIDIVEETERVTLDAWSQVDSNTWQATLSTAQDFSCDFDAGVVRLLFVKLNVSTFDPDVIIRLRAYTTDTDYYVETRTLWNWHCYRQGTFWLVWAICAVPNSKYGQVSGSPDITNITKLEIWIDQPDKVSPDTSQPPIKVTYQRIPRERWFVIDRGSYLLVTFWDSDGNFNLDPERERNFILVINPTPWLDIIRDAATLLPWDSTVQQIKTEAEDASFYYEVYNAYRKLVEYLRRRGIALTKTIRDLQLIFGLGLA